MPPPILPPKPPHLPNLHGQAHPGFFRPVQKIKGRSLTRRQREMLPFIAAEKRNKEIAAALGISEGTVKVYMSHILDKLGLESRSDVRRWWKQRRVPPSAEALWFYL